MQLAYGEWLLRMTDASVRSVALAAMAALVALFLRRRPSAQHALWSLVLGSMLLLPVMRPMVPVTHIDVTPEFAKAVGVPATRLAVGPLPPVHAGSRAPLTRLDWVLLLWAAGVMVFSLRLLAGLLLARKTFRRTVRLEFGAGLPIEESSRVRVPVTVGLWRPKVVLPAGWREWPEAKLQVVLAHEMAHVRRRDPLIACLGR